jgi:large subunit ribosomal protein L9
VGKNGKAFGSVTSIDIHKALEDKGIEIDRTAIQLNKPIKSTGKTDVEIKLHADVATTLTVTVAATEETASA